MHGQNHIKPIHEVHNGDSVVYAVRAKAKDTGDNIEKTTESALVCEL